ncbi:GNAT family N-acetyltransferase [Streptomyces sp. NPDC091268]|uniref:GNAT family N-acetyltransferase n=1 Tax=Streptomyces sp. NPDC091268 TaxID=3365979 RepID=UPI00381DD51D
MAPQEAIAVERMDGSAAARAEDAFRAVYADVFAEPPYGESSDDVAATFDRFRAQTRRRTFRAALARSEDGEPVGVAYGWTVPPDTGWWDELTESVPAEMRREDGQRTFGLMELAVRGPGRRQGVARRLHETLLGGLRAERVLLNVHPDSKAALGAYRAWGYRKIGEARPGHGPHTYDVMVLDLSEFRPDGVSPR